MPFSEHIAFLFKHNKHISGSLNVIFCTNLHAVSTCYINVSYTDSVGSWKNKKANESSSLNLMRIDKYGPID